MLAFSDKLLENKTLMFAAAAVAFLVAALLVLLVFRLAFGRRLRMSGGRTRQPRLGIVDAFDLDRQRQLVIIRRDNVEHLIMIGGPNDIVIESEIVRVEALREARGRDKDVEPKIVPPSIAASEPDVLAADETGIPPAALPIEPMRAPTFPVPQRRVAPPPPPQPLVPQRGASAIVPPVSVERPVDVLPPASTEEPAATPVPAPAASLPPRAPSFLRPPPLRKPGLSPVPPIRPLPPNPVATPPMSAPSFAPPVTPPSAPPPPVSPPKVDASASTPVANAGDPFESLEEEMAKLLGRGPGA